MTRDAMRSSSYFRDAIVEYQTSIGRLVAALGEPGLSDRHAAIGDALTGRRLDLVSLLYSAGATRDVVRHAAGQLVESAAFYSIRDRYYDVVATLSWAVILDLGPNTDRLTARIVDERCEDRLVDVLLSAVRDDWTDGRQAALVRPEYQDLVSAFDSDDLAEASDHLVRYSNVWQHHHQWAGWHEAHLQPGFTYTGYWAPEISAIARIKNLPSSMIDAAVFAPVEL